MEDASYVKGHQQKKEKEKSYVKGYEMLNIAMIYWVKIYNSCSILKRKKKNVYIC